MRTYVIINTSELGAMDFSQLLTTAADTARRNLNDTECIVSFEGETPSFLEGKTTYTHTELFAIVDDINNNWIE